jgi:RNA-directed DNA polymerase
MLKAKQVRALTHGMAAALLGGPWDFDPMIARLADALGRRWRWRRTVVRHLLTEYATPPAYEELAGAIASDASFCNAINDRTRPRIVHWFPLSASMLPAFPEWNLPQISTVDALGSHLKLTYSQLRWLADCEHRQSRCDDSVRNHYRTYWLRKPTGGWRLVEEPLYLLKSAQRRILHDILNCVVPHPAACAFHRSRSIVDYAGAHTGRELVLHLDLKNFFPSIPASRIHAMLTALGYPAEVARLMTGMCTSIAPFRLCRQHRGGEIYSSPHLPQGAPTSPALANLAAFRLDCRLSAAAESVGASYTRYADDLAFSGDTNFARGVNRFQSLVWKIVFEEGFEVNHRKTRVMHKSVRQRLCGLVVNDHLNIDRRSYDRLKAILTNCARHGLETQNRDRHPDFRAHLRGRVAYVEQINPTRGTRLRTLFDRIASC